MLSAERTVTVGTPSISTPQATSSAHTIASNEDLLTEILILLPIKSLLKFKSVSKHWLSLISTPHFCHRRSRRSHHPSPISGLFLERSCGLERPEYKFIRLDGKPSTSPTVRSLTFVHDAVGIMILQSCNGLLFCRSEFRRQPELKYYVCNPTTQQFTTLPQLIDPVSYPVAGIGLAFDPSKSLHYKVLCVRRNDFAPYRYRIEIYSSESGSWRRSGDIFTAPNLVSLFSGVFWNGAIHWLSNLRTIVSFDVDQERHREMPMHEIPNDWYQRKIKHFGESHDHLHLILIGGPRYSQLDVYEMERDYSRWFVKYQVDFNRVPSEFPVLRRARKRLDYLVRGENDQDSCLVLPISGRVICYSFKDNTLKKLCDLAGSSSLGRRHAFQYIETLACV